MDVEDRVNLARKLMETRQEKTAYYDSWSKGYDQDVLSGGYRGPEVLAETMATLYSEGRSDVLILDVAAGTGLVGEKLATHGFTTTDALDPSQGMLDEADAKGVYRDLICAYMDENELDVKADTYSAVVICGGCTNNHLPCNCLWEVIRLVKPGGYFIMVTRPFYLNNDEEYKDKFEPFIDELEQMGKWRKIKKEVFPRYHGDLEGIIFLYQILKQ